MQDLASELLEIFTARKMAKAFFTNSGSEANDTQVLISLGSAFAPIFLDSLPYFYVFPGLAGEVGLVLQ